jgi:hypothetical protein
MNCEEMVVGCLSGVTKESPADISQCNRSPGRVSGPGTPDYDAEC